MAGKLFSRRGSKSSNAPAAKQVKLKLMHIDFWSAVRMGLLITVALGIATIVGFIFLWIIVSFTGLGASLNNLLSTVGLTTAGQGVQDTLTFARVFTFAFGIAVFNMVIGTILAGIWALIFNVIARFTGGLSVGFTNN
ncbi:MAG: DUF3566 domain-containing protein [Microbacteriaceae bacterium]